MGHLGVVVPVLIVVGFAEVCVEWAWLGIGIELVFEVIPADGRSIANRKWKAGQWFLAD